MNVDDDVYTGAVVSTTLTVLVTAVASLPEASVAVYVRVYDPTVLTSTSPVVVAVKVPDISATVAPASVNTAPNSCVTGLSPVSVITGAVVSTTLTTLVAVAVLPSKSVAVYVKVDDPTVEVSTEPDVVTDVLPWLSSSAVAP